MPPVGALTIAEVRRIAALARLRLSPEEEARYAEQLGTILGYIDQLARFETEAESDGAPASAPVADRPGGQIAPDFAPLAHAPETLDVFYLVPQVKVTGDG